MKVIPLISAITGGTATALLVAKKPLPVPAKIGITLAGAGVGFLLGGQISKMIGSGASRDTVETASNELEKLLKKNTSLPPGAQQIPSFSPAQMKSYANKLYQAMDGIGTDNNAVKDVFTAMNHDVDLLLLIEAFGIKDDENLTDWLNDDGATSYVNQILATKPKVTFRF